MKIEKSKVKETLDASGSCASKDCNGRGIFFMKLTVANVAGMFCKTCAYDLKSKGLAEEVVKN